MNIFLTGSNGRLGSFIKKNTIGHNVIPHYRQWFDLCDKQKVEQNLSKKDIDIIVHTAAYTNVQQSNNETRKVFEDNILATVNILDFAWQINAKFIHISTDSVFDGKEGPYSIGDKVCPVTAYGDSKTACEFFVKLYHKHLIIRTSFFEDFFPFDCACTDRITSKDYIDITGPKIIDEILNKDRYGIIHIGSKGKSYYDLAKQRKPDVKPIKCLKPNDNTGKDYSFNDSTI